MKRRLHLSSILLQAAYALSLLALLMIGCQPPSGEERKTAENRDSVKTEVLAVSSNIPKGVMNSDGEYTYDLGSIIELKLKNGNILMVGENSSEAKIVQILEDSTFKVDKNKWITLNHIYFETGSNKIKDESKEQLENIVKIMKAYPNLVLKMGGYTDNTGDSVKNIKLSGQRAQAAANFIIQKGGFLPLKVESEGYGAKHFICAENNTDECKAVNRRVDVSIREK